MVNTLAQTRDWEIGTGESGWESRFPILHSRFPEWRYRIPILHSRFGSLGHYDLDAWKVSRKPVSDVYRLTQSFPREELFGLTAQIRRASVSVPSNIAEGAARTSSREYTQFLNVARGSLSELETQLFIAADLGYIKSDHPVFYLVDRVSKLVTGLHKAIRNR